MVANARFLLTALPHLLHLPALILRMLREPNGTGNGTGNHGTGTGTSTGEYQHAPLDLLLPDTAVVYAQLMHKLTALHPVVGSGGFKDKPAVGAHDGRGGHKGPGAGAGASAAPDGAGAGDGGGELLGRFEALEVQAPVPVPVPVSMWPSPGGARGEVDTAAGSDVAPTQPTDRDQSQSPDQLSPPIDKKESVCAFYVKTGTCNYGDDCIFFHPPDQKAVCDFYVKTGTCNYGDDCIFFHPAVCKFSRKAGTCNYNGCKFAHPTVCRFYMETGTCSYGDDCMFLHPAVRACKFYMKTGTCAFGDGCKFAHPQVARGYTNANGRYSVSPAA